MTQFDYKYSNIYYNLDTLKEILVELPKDSVVVYTYGAWDILHPGHISQNTIFSLDGYGIFVNSGQLMDTEYNESVYIGKFMIEVSTCSSIKHR